MTNAIIFLGRPVSINPHLDGVDVQSGVGRVYVDVFCCLQYSVYFKCKSQAYMSTALPERNEKQFLPVFKTNSHPTMTTIYPRSDSKFAIILCEVIEQQSSNWPSSIFPQHCAVGATFPTTRVMQCSSEEEKPCIRTLLVLTQPRPQDQQRSRCARCLYALLPSRPATTICSLAQPTAPHAGQTQSADTLTPHT